MSTHEYVLLCPIVLPLSCCCMFTQICKQHHILIASLFSISLDMKLRRTGNDRAELYVKSMNSYTVIPSFATFDRVPLSHFLCLSVSTEEDGAMHYIQSLCPADGSLSPHRAQVSCPPYFLCLSSLVLKPLWGGMKECRILTCGAGFH